MNPFLPVESRLPALASQSPEWRGRPLALHLSQAARPDREIGGIITDGAVALLPVSGVLGKHLPWYASYDGESFDLATLEGWVLGLMARADISTVVVLANSPGGSASAGYEASLLVRELAAVKRTVTFVDNVCASAMYWIACATDEIFATPGATLGSIGTIRSLIDQAAAWEEMGLKREIFASGEMKWLGLSGTSLTDGQRAFLESDLAEWNARFTGFVRERRAGIPADVFDGRWLSADAALSAGLIDGMSLTLSHFLAGLLTSGL
jgi:ClpP class serine protease